MPTEHSVRWYEDDRPTLPSELEFRCATQASGWEWEPCDVYGQHHYSHCLEGSVMSEPGWIQARGVFGSSDEVSGWSNIQALPEPAGLVWGVLALVALWGRRRAG